MKISRFVVGAVSIGASAVAVLGGPVVSVHGVGGEEEMLDAGRSPELVASAPVIVNGVGAPALLPEGSADVGLAVRFSSMRLGGSAARLATLEHVLRSDALLAGPQGAVSPVIGEGRRAVDSLLPTPGALALVGVGGFGLAAARRGG